MRTKYIFKIITILSLFTYFAHQGNDRAFAAENPLDYVDPLIGTMNEGHCYPVVCVPFGMARWVPQTKAGEQKNVPAYFYDDTKIQGFRCTNFISGSAVPEYGSMTITPLTGSLKVGPEARASRFSHENETATPYYYRVFLDEYNITAEITSTTRAGYFRFIFPETDNAYILVQPNNDPYADHTRGSVGYARVIPERNEIVGFNPAFRYYASTGKPAGFAGYFVARFNRPIESYGVWRGEEIRPGTDEEFGQPGGYAHFKTRAGEVIEVKIGISFSSIAQARKNLDAEIPGWNFEKIKDETKEVWGKALGKIEVEGGTRDKKVSFYTALYHSLMLPKPFSDVDGSYVGFADDSRIHTSSEHPYYDDFSVWDTYRAEHPLLLLLEPGRCMEMMNSLILKAEQGGWLPIFPAWNSYTTEMIGDHVISLFSDAYMKGFRDFDIENAYRYMKKNATETPEDYADYVDGKGRRALESYLKYGYIPLEDPVAEAFHFGEQVSRVLEYAYDDFCLAELANELGKTDDYEMFRKRAFFYKNVFDPAVGFMRGRHADGTWDTPFDPNVEYSYITEGTSWHYTWYVPHDVQGLINLMGGRETFIAKLDSVFEQGYYWHGNEPSHQIAYLYAYAGAPWKTQAQVPQILKTEYNTGPGGLSGNDDAGQMSAWYILSAMGFYTVCPGTPVYVIGTPSFEKVTIRLDPQYYDGDTFVITAENVSEKNVYIQSAELNGNTLNKPWFKHSDIKNGGTLNFIMGPEPNKHWGSKPEDAPPSMTEVKNR